MAISSTAAKYGTPPNWVLVGVLVLVALGVLVAVLFEVEVFPGTTIFTFTVLVLVGVTVFVCVPEVVGAAVTAVPDTIVVGGTCVGSGVEVSVGTVGSAVVGTGDFVHVAGNTKGVSVGVGISICCGTITGRIDNGRTFGMAKTTVKMPASASVPMSRIIVRIFQAVSFIANPSD